MSGHLSDPTPILIIGYGNSLRRDDGAGFHAAEELESEFSPCPPPVPEHEPGVIVIACPQLVPEFSDDISRASRVIFIDACCDRPPGDVTRRDLAPGTASVGALNHSLGPAGLLSLTQTVFGHAPPAVLFTIGGRDFGIGEELSDPVRRAIDDVKRQVRQMVHR